MKIKLLIILIFSFVFANSQTTFKVMQFNLLNYGNYYGDCTSSNNNVDNKNEYMKTIISYLEPDIICVNELENNAYYADYLLDNALNQDGRNYYQRANVNGNGYTINMIYYDSRKFVLDGEDNIWADPRRINAYKMHFKDAGNLGNAEITFVSGHLKASEGADNETKRANATANVMSYMVNSGTGNYIFLGDFNLYTSNEEAYQNIINPSNSPYKLYDPVNHSGNWHNNYNSRYYHTQSSHSSTNCAVGGGLDDRFDFIMMSEYIKNGTNHYQYVLNSYTTVAQDGNHYNDAINFGTNNSGVPENVINAIYNMSDHLPVTMEMEVDQNTSSVNKLSNLEVKYNNPVLNKLVLTINSNKILNLQIFSIRGKLIFNTRQIFNKFENPIDLSFLKQGMYIMRISGKDINLSKKFIKINKL